MAAQDSISNSSFEVIPGSMKGKNTRVRSPYTSPNRSRMVFHHLMLVPRGYGSPHFKGKEITTFLKALNRYFKDYRINNDEEKKERTVEYVAKQVRRDIEQLPEYQDL